MRKRAIFLVIFLICRPVYSGEYDWQVYSASQSTLNMIKKYVSDHRLVKVDWRNDDSNPEECAKLTSDIKSGNYEFIPPDYWGENWNASALSKFKPYMKSRKIGTESYPAYGETVYIARENIAIWVRDFNEDGKDDLMLYGQKWLDDEGVRERMGTGNYDLYDYKTLKYFYYVPIDDPYNSYKKEYSKSYSGVFKMNSHYYVVQLQDNISGVEPNPYLFFYRYTKKPINKGKTFSDTTCRLQLLPKISQSRVTRQMIPTV